MHTTENTKCIVVKVVGHLWCHLPWPTEELKLHSSQHVKHSVQSKHKDNTIINKQFNNINAYKSKHAHQGLHKTLVEVHHLIQYAKRTNAIRFRVFHFG